MSPKMESVFGPDLGRPKRADKPRVCAWRASGASVAKYAVTERFLFVRTVGIQLLFVKTAKVLVFAIFHERTHIVNLETRISWLESIVRSRCPDIDLSKSPSQDETTARENDAAVDETMMSLPGSPVPRVAEAANVFVNEPSTETSRVPVASNLELPGAGANALSHEIGLVSLGANQDPRYIGPSSGYFLAKLMLHLPSRNGEDAANLGARPSFPTQLVEAVQGPLPMPPRSMLQQLCNAYFDVVHAQYPVLNQDDFTTTLVGSYDKTDQDPLFKFQSFMVFAIGATVLSGRLKARIPGESYCLSAMQYFEQLNLENSLQGLQCLVLLLIFAIHSPYVRMNVWYLNYHCLAALLDLGLQRDIGTRSGILVKEQEMRARIFWVVYTLDRTIATIMRRPIGLRDEACDLRMPRGFSDENLAHQTSGRENAIDPMQMAFAMHLFRAAKLNSEIKYVANSVVRNSPNYAYPSIIDINDWQRVTLLRLDEWEAQIPEGRGAVEDYYLQLTCRIRYHSLRMLLLRPSPAIPKPSSHSLTKCLHSACETISLFDTLYRKNLLVHTWLTFHALVLSTITMLYCIKAVPEIARRTEVDVLMGRLSMSLSVLSAAGEHWSGAKRSRDILDELGRSTVRWLQESGAKQHFDSQTRPTARGDQFRTEQAVAVINSGSTMPAPRRSSHYAAGEVFTEGGFGNMGADDLAQTPFNDFITNGTFTEFFEASDSINIDNIIQDLFQDFIPIYPNTAI
ncbi:hypothetical protein G7046_g8386 [Stylonectria norvegica]|nr:hypothetical protein G7046_g8386 [Stylonectria norvegica]